jgi:peptidoglycan/xylan/chitin deacetylase (PgdA/CDA1 family)
VKKNKKGLILKGTAALVLALLLFAAYADVKSSSVVPVLMYHSFNTDEGKYASLCLEPARLARQIKYLIDGHYNIIGLDKVVAYMTKEEKMPARTVAITADDGYESFYEVLYPLLKKYKIPAAVFVIVDRVGQDGYMDWKEIREMSDSGLVTIGSHTATHPWLPSVSVDEDKLRDELAGSRDAIEKHIGKSVGYICYPNGGFNDLVKEAAKKYGYKAAFTTNPKKRSDINDIYAIRRIKISGSSDDPVTFWGKVSRYYAWFKERR